MTVPAGILLQSGPSYAKTAALAPDTRSIAAARSMVNSSAALDDWAT
jgi:hypothetical protein